MEDWRPGAGPTPGTAQHSTEVGPGRPGNSRSNSNIDDDSDELESGVGIGRELALLGMGLGSIAAALAGRSAEGLARLTSLNLHGNQIAQIEGLDALRSLRHLDLSSNCLARLRGLEALTHLQTLNLANNRLSCGCAPTTSGPLQHPPIHLPPALVVLSLAYNQLRHMAPLCRALAASSAVLRRLDLRSNLLQDAEEVLASLAQLPPGLTDLQLADNPLHGPPGPSALSRDSIFAAVPSLCSLDGRTRDNLPTPAAGREPMPMPGLEAYLDFLHSSPSSAAASADDGHSSSELQRHPHPHSPRGRSTRLTTPNIDRAMSFFRQRRQQQHQQQQQQQHEHPSSEQSPRAQGTRAQQRMQEQEERIRALEEQLLRLQPPSNTAAESPSRPGQRLAAARRHRQHFLLQQEQQRAEAAAADDSDEQQQPRQRSPGRTPRSNLFPSPSRPRSAHDDREGDGDLSPAEDLDDQPRDRNRPSADTGAPTSSETETTSGSVTAQLGRELAHERERRLKAEQAARKLTREIKAEQKRTNFSSKQHQTTLDAVGQLERALSESEARARNAHQMLVSTERDREQMHEEIERLHTELAAEQAQRRAQAARLEKLEQEKGQWIDEHSEMLRTTEAEHIKARAELDVLRKALQQAKKQIQQMQALLAAREEAHRRATEDMVPRSGPEIRQVAEHARREQRQADERERELLQHRLDQSNDEYKKLEAEFREALTTENKKLQTALAEVSSKTEIIHQLQQENQRAHMQENQARGLLEELTLALKDQKMALDQATEDRDNMARLLHESNAALEAAHKAAKEGASLAQARKEEADRQANRIMALEGVIRGLRDERALWSRELAAQGASLAADRGKLESRLAMLSAELESARASEADHLETMRIKSKMLDDKSEVARKLELKLQESQRELSNLRAESERREHDLQDRLEAERGLSQQLQDDLEATVEKKSRLKTALGEATAELQLLRKEAASSRAQWQEKSDIITQLEQEVEELRRGFRRREEELLAGKEEAVAAFSKVEARLEECETAFQRQLRDRDYLHNQALQRIADLEAELEQARQRIGRHEEEMRALLQEMNETKKRAQQKMTKFQRLFRELQNDGLDD